MLTRRTFLGHSALAAAAAVTAPILPQTKPAAMPSQRQTLANKLADPLANPLANIDPFSLARFVDPLALSPIAVPVRHTAAPGSPSQMVPAFRMEMRAFSAKLHRDLPATRMWGFNGVVPGPVLDTRSGEGLMVEWVNALPPKHFLPIDHHLMGAEKNLPEVRSVVHLHGGKTPPEGDGYPEDWYVPGQSRTFFYPNQQESALLWYHDHAMGINRLNIYAGLMGLFIIRDGVEEALGLPKGKYEIPLVIMDRNLTLDGQLSYPVSADPERPWVPEVFGEAQLVNGKLFPYLDVEPCKYRFRILNGANGRFYRLSLSEPVEMHQIGTDQGLLGAPVPVSHVQLAPGERADLVIDFSQHRGAQLELKSDAFPLMQFRVGRADVAAGAAGIAALPAQLRPVPRIPEATAVRTRRLTLDESLNMVSESMGMLLNKTPWHMPVTEKPVLNSTEIWELVNLTDDTHPIHLHMVRFQILGRRRFDGFEYMTTGKLRYTSDVMAPEANEMGWKDTVRVNAKTVTRIVVPFTGYAGRYVWHCHILEHEDNEMMRPYEVLPESRASESV